MSCALNYSVFHYVIDVPPRFISFRDTASERSLQDEECLKFKASPEEIKVPQRERSLCSG